MESKPQEGFNPTQQIADALKELNVDYTQPDFSKEKAIEKF